MKDKVKFIVEDLLPLYNEGLLREETKEWVEAQLKGNDELMELAELSNAPLPDEKIESTVNHDLMMKKINQKLSLYQIVFVAISFFLAVQTSILNESFGFVLWYTVLGVVTYLFYRNMKIVFLIAFLPIFLWSVGSSLHEYINGLLSVTLWQFLWQTVFGSILMSLIHFAFAIVGCLIGWLILKLREKE